MGLALSGATALGANCGEFDEEIHSFLQFTHSLEAEVWKPAR
jgi:hypothetical protein